MDLSNYHQINTLASNYGAQLVVVTKNQSIEDIVSVFNEGHCVFGENKVQELINKKNELPSDIEWHMIGSLQKNKVKLIAAWIDMIHSVDSFGLAKKIDQEAKLNNRVIPILLEVKITDEESKHGFIESELISSLYRDNWDILHNIKICGLMGMASFTANKEQIQMEFRKLTSIFKMLQSNYFKNPEFNELSFGMSGDYEIALEEGSTMIRVGSKIFNR
jgi:pyridoxal phosphate enzyme (YggS family)